MKATVRVMRSFDYNHFEVSLSSDEDMTIQQIDSLRKEAARLVDKAILQYQIMKRLERAKTDAKFQNQTVLKHDRDLALLTPEKERTELEKAAIKAHDDHVFLLTHDWDYQDEWYERFSS